MSLDNPWAIRGRTRTVDFPNRLLLAPMEGITDPVFRDVAMQVGGIGGALTEFIRISVAPVPRKVIARSWGSGITPAPVGVQFMAADADHLAKSVVNAEALGAPWIDLNFGCPAPVVFSKCAGSALLDHPDRLTSIIRTAVAATGLPVSAKMRAGVRDPGRLSELVVAAAEAGAHAVTLHARLRITSYDEPATWSWIRQAREALDRAGHGHVSLIGNGGVETPDDARRMLAETGCTAVMIGRAALADPWIFRAALGGPPAGRVAGAGFALAYAAAIMERREPHVALKKLKQMIRWYRAGGLLVDEPDVRRTLLRTDDLHQVLDWFRAVQE